MPLGMERCETLNYEMYEQRTYYARRELGLCVKCGMDVEEQGKYKLCAACREKYRQRAELPEKREWRKQYQKDYREEIAAMCERIALAVQKLIDAEELRMPDRSAPAGHKCWHCFWANWCGDRFFCPIYETCIKEPIHREVVNDPV